MRRDALFATKLVPSLVLWASVGWSGAYQAGPLVPPDSSEKLCRADQIASFDPFVEETSEKPERERVFGTPLRGVPTKGIIEAASTLLDYPMGSKFIMEVNGTPYGFRLEPHYHPPGFEGGPIGWHKGVTVYEIEERDAF
jgi:hypothetical protein